MAETYSNEKLIKTLLKNRRKAEPFFKDMPTVHFNDGNEVGEEYLLALMSAYVKEPCSGNLSNGEMLSSELKKDELETFCIKALKNFLEDGGDVKNKWIMFFCSVHGGDKVVELLKGLIAEWAVNTRTTMAKYAVKALAINPNPLSIVLVDNMSRKFKQASVRSGSKEALKFAAEKFDLTPEQLLDKIVPTLGFDSDGTETFDYGERTFKVTLGCDQQLLVFDQNGKALKTLPSPSQNDNPELAENELARFKELKKQLKATVTLQKTRLDIAISDGRRWTKPEFINLFVKNAVMQSFATGLIFGIYNDKTLLTTFRCMEDGTFNSHDDREITLPDDCLIGLIHPLEIDLEVKESWKKQLLDYEIKQPLKQLERKVFSFPPEMQSGKEITTLAGRTVHISTMANKLQAYGWIKSKPISHSYYESFSKLDDKLEIGAQLNFSGAYLGEPSFDPITVKQIKFYSKEHHSIEDFNRQDSHYLSINDIDAKFLSEIVYQVDIATATSKEINENWRNTGGM